MWRRGSAGEACGWDLRGEEMWRDVSGDGICAA